MKRIVTAFLVVAALAVLFSPAEAQYRKNAQWIGANVTLLSDPAGFGANYEYGLHENMSLGGMFRYFSSSQETFVGEITLRWFLIQVYGNYHFMPEEQLDPYAGARLGYAVFDYTYETSDPRYNYTASGSSDLTLSLVGGTRYFFTPRIAGNAALEINLAGDVGENSVWLLLGVDFQL